MPERFVRIVRSDGSKVFETHIGPYEVAELQATVDGSYDVVLRSQPGQFIEPPAEAEEPEESEAQEPEGNPPAEAEEPEESEAQEPEGNVVSEEPSEPAEDEEAHPEHEPAAEGAPVINGSPVVTTAYIEEHAVPTNPPGPDPLTLVD